MLQVLEPTGAPSRPQGERARRHAAGEPSPGADVAAGEPSPGADVAAGEPSPGADVAVDLSVRFFVLDTLMSSYEKVKARHNTPPSARMLTCVGHAHAA